ncbi:hypothetical protein E3N88_15737 [Mikania micrantha]|uniref:Reverse transcriptase/retrotransposon-derived protein RNase H-like domain-containing protein n=1 Tax=Mikania micrantha TaxID=192012 RepID=A0A5N6NXK7_9ASTR|nr:hypothetical protein E3N88_15737 [Mikania micrantha]
MKEVKFECGNAQQTAFDELKKRLTEAPILGLPEGTEDMVIYSDASYLGLGCVLMQRGKQKELNMRRRRWLELIKDYDCEIRYHPGKANIVADALNRKEGSETIHVKSFGMELGVDMVWLLNVVKDTWSWFIEIALGRCRGGCDLPLHMPYTYAYFGLSWMCQ